MRPVLRLLGKCDLTINGEPVPFKITRKLWYALGLVATAPHCDIGRNELTEAVWPLSEQNSRSVLLFKWRRSLLDAIEPFIPDGLITVTDQNVSLNTDYIDIDYQQCCSLAKIALTSDNALQVLEAGTAFDTIAEDRVLLSSFSSAFLELREQFDKQRMAVLRRARQAETHLYPESHTDKFNFELRLRMLGDEDAIGEPDLPFKALPEQSTDRMQKGIISPTVVLFAATVVIGLVSVASIFLSSRNALQNKNEHAIIGNKVNKPISDLSRHLLYQLIDSRIRKSAATAICITTKNQIVAAGDATLANGRHESITLMLTNSGTATWVTKLTDVTGIKTIPKQIISTENGRIYVASLLIAQRNNLRKLAPGSYMAISVFTEDGQRVFERVHPAAIDGNEANPIRLTPDLKGGIHALASSAQNHASVVLHVPAGPSSGKSTPLTGFPKAFRITDAVSDDKDHIFLLGYVPVKTNGGVRLDWHIQALDKASKTLWSRDIKGGESQVSTSVRGLVNAQGDLVVYGPLPSPNVRNGGRKVASLVTLSAASGNVIFSDRYDSEKQNVDFALRCLPTGNSALICVTNQASNGSETINMHRFGNAATDTALTLTVRFADYKRVGSIISLYFDDNGALIVLLQPSNQPAANTALMYISKVVGREISTGNLSADVPFGYNTRGGALIAGHYDNSFCVYDFSRLP